MIGQNNSRFRQALHEIADVFALKDTQVEELREIIELEQNRSISRDEAEEIGKHLISFYEHLAGDLKITKGGIKNKKF